MRRLRADPVDLGLSCALAFVVLGPLLLGRGFWLYGDMVFVPEQPWKSAWLGLDGALPRAVPMDALVSVATHVLPGDIVQKLLLTAGFVLGGLGVARLVRELRPDAAWYVRAAGITLSCWNPWVFDRLAIGQWAILLGYFTLPWVAVSGLRLGRSIHAWAGAGVALTVAACCSPSSGIMAVLVLAVLALGRERRVWWQVGALAVAANLTWAVPALTAPGAEVSTDGVFGVFAARAESSAGVLASLLSLGGIWKTSIVSPERGSAAVVLLSCVVTAVALAALWRHRRWRWLALGGVSLLLALAPVLPGGEAVLEGLGEHVPGVAMLRDSHRFLAPLGLVLAVGSADAVAVLRSWVRPGTGSLWAGVVLLVVAPLLLLPSLAWGGLGEVERATYPAEWGEVAAQVDDDDLMVVLPWHGNYRGFDWNGRRAVLDPSPRYFRGTVLVDDRLRVGPYVVAAEDPRVEVVTAALDSADPDVQAERLAAAGVDLVLVEKGMGRPVVPSGTVRHEGAGLILVGLTDTAADGALAGVEVSVARRVLIVTGHVVALVLLLMGAAVILRTGSNEHHTA